MPETRETYELLKNYIEEIPIGLILFDGKGNLVSWNSSAVKLLEANNESLKKNDLGILTSQIKEILTNEKLTEKEIIGLSKPLKIKKVLTGDKNIILLITDAYQEYIAEMSHELRRPITNVKTLTESLLLGAKNDPEASQKFLEQINNEVDRLTRLVNELISLSKVRSGSFSQTKRKINLKQKIDDAIKVLQPLIETNKTNITNEIPDGYEIFVEPEQIDHVIQNLIENAIKYSNPGSSIVVKAGPGEGSFQVDDSGIGIAESEIPKIFNRFYRVDRTRSKGSSGLGLSIVKSVVDLHGGRIEVKSKVGVGSSFIVYFPKS